MRVAFHADDLGQSPAITDGICEAFRRGLLTGSSVLANAPDADRALAAWKTLEEDRRRGGLPSQAKRSSLDDPQGPFDLGVHLNLTQGPPLLGSSVPDALLDGTGCFRGLRNLVELLKPGARRYAEAVRRELTAQIERVLDHSIRPSRLDGHQYCELVPVVGHAVRALAERHGIPAVRVAREPGVCGTLATRDGSRGMAEWPLTIAKKLLAAHHAARSRRAGLHHAEWFFGTVTAGRVGRRLIDRFLGIASHRGAASIEIGLHPGRRTTAAGGDEKGTANQEPAWNDPLADLRPRELEWLVDDAATAWLGSRGIRLGRTSAGAPETGSG